MDREKFIREYNMASKEINKPHIKKSIDRSIEAGCIEGLPRGYNNLIIVIEELSELQQVVSKKLRGDRDNVHLREEMADVLLGIMYLQNVFNIETEELYKAINVKIDRLNSVIDRSGVYR